MIFLGRTIVVFVLIFGTLAVLQKGSEKYLSVQSTSHRSSLRRLKRWIEHNRPEDSLKNHEIVHRAFEPIADLGRNSTVTVLRGDTVLALGVAIGPERVITKASVLSGSISCRVRGQGKLKARIIARDKNCDLALLELPGANLTPVVFSSQTNPPIGTVVMSMDGRSAKPFSIGIVSANQRLIERDVALLGIFMDPSPGGPRVMKVLEGSAAEDIELRENDVITHLNQVTISTRQQLIDGIKRLNPGEEVQLKVVRNGSTHNLEGPLTRMEEVLATEQGFEDHLGGKRSVRRSGFPEIIQHDGDVPVDQCGGPLFNLDGHLQGINIARFGRVSSYALPASLVQRKIAELGWHSLSVTTSAAQ